MIDLLTGLRPVRSYNGNWPGSIGIQDKQSMDSLLHVMTEEGGE